MSITKCDDCEKKMDIDIDDCMYVGEDIPLCEDCYHADMDSVEATIIDGHGFKTYKTYYQVMTEDGDQLEQGFIKDYADSVKRIATDGWRGYYRGDAPKGFKQVDTNSCFCVFDWENIDDVMDKINKITKDDIEYLQGFDYFLAILTTSNVFSSGFELYIRKNQAEEFIASINRY